MDGARVERIRSTLGLAAPWEDDLMCNPTAFKATLAGVLLCSLLTACANPAPAPVSGDHAPASNPEPVRPAPKRLVAAIMAEPPALHRALIPPGFVIQTADVVDTILNVGLTSIDNQGVRRPMLAE